jgi:hypothetical protein
MALTARSLAFVQQHSYPSPLVVTMADEGRAKVDPEKSNSTLVNLNEPGFVQGMIGPWIRDMSLSIPRLDALRAGIELYGATGFSPFEIFAPSENTLSRVIVELFDPRGSHGQGALFLNALLVAVGLPRVSAREAVRVEREVLTRERRRIDVVIETSRYVIGIENKPWAIQQPDQLRDYLLELSADLQGRAPVLIFLSDQEARSAELDVVKVPYFAWDNAPSLHSILQGTVDGIKAGKPREFVLDFVSYIDRTFGSGHHMDATDTPYTDAVNAEFDEARNRKALAAILLSQSNLHRRIINEVGTYLLSEVRGAVAKDFVAGDPTTADCLKNQYVPWGLRRPSWPANCEIALESQKVSFDQVKFGVKAPDTRRIGEDAQGYASPGRPRLEDLAKHLPGGRKTAYWPWEQVCWESNWGPEFAGRLVLQSPTGAVADHPDVRDLARRFVELARTVDALLS